MVKTTNSKTAARWFLAGVAAAALAAPTVARAAEKKTERLWKANCAACHGTEGKGDTEKGAQMKIPDFTSAAWQKKATDDQIRGTIANGVSKTADGVKKEMDPFKDKLKPEQIDALAGYIRSLAK